MALGFHSGNVMINSFSRSLLIRQLHPASSIRFSRFVHSNRSSPSPGLLARRVQWWRSQWRTNKAGIAVHLSLLSGFFALYTFVLREYLEPYLPSAIQPPGAEPLHPQRFRRFDLVSRLPFSETSNVFTLAVHGPKWVKTSYDYEEAWKQGVWSVEIKQPQLQIARAYTPLPPLRARDESASAVNPSDLRFLIRKERQGEVSGYLHRLPIGADHVEIRGPHIEYRLPHDVQEVVFLAGGTGIAPALQIAHCLSLRKGNAVVGGNTRMRILWANRTRHDAFGLEADMSQSSGALLDQLKTMGSDKGFDLQVECFLDEERTLISRQELRRAMTSDESAKGKKLVLVSGPDGFIKYLVGPKEMRNGFETQGPIGGVLGQVGFAGWDVWKL